MKRLLKSLLLLIVVLVITVALFLFSMRFHDGPLEIISGGPFKTGDLTDAPEDWSFLADRQTIQFQTLDPARSRTVWLAVVQGRLFIISGYMTTNYGAIWKQWPHYLDNDDRVILRVDDKLYEQRLRRIMAGPIIEPVLTEFARKYFDSMGIGSAEVTEGHSWMYEVVDR